MTRIAYFVPFVVGLAAMQPAHGGEERWGFCLSADFAARRAFVTEAFASGESRPTLEGWFLTSLKRQGADMPFAQCPMPSDRLGVAQSIDQAARFLREFGFSVDVRHVSTRS